MMLSKQRLIIKISFLAVLLLVLGCFLFKKNKPAEETNNLISVEQLSQNEVQAAENSQKPSLLQKISSSLSKKGTPAPTPAIDEPNSQDSSPETPDNDKSNNSDHVETQSQITPTPTVIITPTVVFTPSSTPAPTVFVAKAVSSPTPTQTPTPVPDIGGTGISSQRKEVFLAPPGNFTLEARGNAVILTTENANGFWNFSVTASFEKLMPGRNYQLWLMNDNGSSCNEAKFVSDGNGNGSINAVITHNQAKDPLTVVKVYEIPPSGQEVPNDPTACFMLGNNSIPCLAGSVYF